MFGLFKEKFKIMAAASIKHQAEKKEEKKKHECFSARVADGRSMLSFDMISILVLVSL